MSQALEPINGNGRYLPYCTITINGHQMVEGDFKNGHRNVGCAELPLMAINDGNHFYFHIPQIIQKSKFKT